MPRWIVAVIVVLGVASLLPLALIAVDRATPSPNPRPSLINDMDHQPKFKTQAVNELFADGRITEPGQTDWVIARGDGSVTADSPARSRGGLSNAAAAMAWIVLPRPMSSARHPPSSRLRRVESHCTPSF
mgnify:CR=1 FL=1